MSLKKGIAGFVLFIFDIGAFASEVLYPLNILMGVITPLIPENVLNSLYAVSWTLTVFLFIYLIIKYIYGVGYEEDDFMDKERGQLEKKLKG